MPCARHDRLGFVLIGLAIAAGPLPVLAQAARPAAPAQAAPPRMEAGGQPRVAFRCPASGIAVEVRTPNQLNDSVSQGPDPSDPTLCRWKRGFTVTESYYGLATAATTEGLAELRAGFQDLFDGKREQFSVRKSSIAVGGGRNEYDDVWRRLPGETITVAGRTVNAVVFQNEQRGVRLAISGTQKMWYDIATGIWVKREVNVPAGTVWGVNWEMNKIVEP